MVPPTIDKKVTTLLIRLIENRKRIDGPNFGRSDFLGSSPREALQRKFTRIAHASLRVQRKFTRTTQASLRVAAVVVAVVGQTQDQSPWMQKRLQQ